jgi:hypothetical protein
MGASSDRNLSNGDEASSAKHRQAEEHLQAVELQLNATRQELQQARCQLAEYEALLGELPDIFERKFQQRQQPFLLQQQLLTRENQSLRQIVKRADRPTPPPPPPPALKLAPPAEPARPPEPPRTSPGVGQPRPWAMAAAAKALAIGLGFVALGAALGTMRQSVVGQAPIPAAKSSPPAVVPAPQSAPAPAKPTPPKPAPNLLVLNSSGPNWVQVRTLNRQPVYEGMLKGEKTLPLGQGLQVLAGRPDLLTVRQGTGESKLLGRIDQLVWFSFKPQAPPASKPAPDPKT